MSINTISTFKNVVLKFKSLLILDIDETILRYSKICENWWKHRYNIHYKTYGNFSEADNACLLDWKAHIKSVYPVHNDKEGFFDLIDRAKNLKCKSIIVTARDNHIKQITYDHLNHLGINNINVYFTAGGNKAHLSDEIMKDEIHHYDEIVIVDDKEKNLLDVRNHFGEKVKCYKFEMTHDDCH